MQFFNVNFTGLVFFDPPRDPINLTLAKYNIENYINVYQAVSCAITRQAFLFVCTCTLPQLGMLQERFSDLSSLRKKSVIQVGTLTLARQRVSPDWTTPTMGLLYVWKNFSDCTNKVQEGFLGVTQSFAFPSSTKGMYKGNGKIVDATELPAGFCRKLISRHTEPGDWVIDLCSGSGAFALAAFAYGRNVVAVEKEATRFNWIASRLRGAKESTPAQHQGLEAKIQDEDDVAQAQAFNLKSDDDEKNDESSSDSDATTDNRVDDNIDQSQQMTKHTPSIQT